VWLVVRKIRYTQVFKWLVSSVARSAFWGLEHSHLLQATCPINIVNGKKTNSTTWPANVSSSPSSSSSEWTGGVHCKQSWSSNRRSFVLVRATNSFTADQCTASEYLRTQHTHTHTPGDDYFPAAQSSKLPKTILRSAQVFLNFLVTCSTHSQSNEWEWTVPTAATVNAANQHHLQTNSVITNFTQNSLAGVGCNTYVNWFLLLIKFCVKCAI